MTGRPVDLVLLEPSQTLRALYLMRMPLSWQCARTHWHSDKTSLECWPEVESISEFKAVWVFTFALASRNISLPPAIPNQAFSPAAGFPPTWKETLLSHFPSCEPLMIENILFPKGNSPPTPELPFSPIWSSRRLSPAAPSRPRCSSEEGGGLQIGVVRCRNSIGSLLRSSPQPTGWASRLAGLLRNAYNTLLSERVILGERVVGIAQLFGVTHSHTPSSWWNVRLRRSGNLWDLSSEFRTRLDHLQNSPPEKAQLGLQDWSAQQPTNVNFVCLAEFWAHTHYANTQQIEETITILPRESWFVFFLLGLNLFSSRKSISSAFRRCF